MSRNQNMDTELLEDFQEICRILASGLLGLREVSTANKSANMVSIRLDNPAEQSVYVAENDEP